METTLYVKWDGLCLDEGSLEDQAYWRNAHDVGEGQRNPPVGKDAGEARAPISQSNRGGVALRTQRAQVCVVKVDPWFAPVEEYALIKLSVRNIHKAGSLVLQIWDATDKTLVYAEGLTQQQLWGLPRTEKDALEKSPPWVAADGDGDEERAEKLTQRRQHRWANPVDSPYRVKVIISEHRMTAEDFAGMAGYSALIRNPWKIRRDDRDVSVNSTFKVKGEEAPLLDADQTSVRFTGVAALELVPWPDVYKDVTGDAEYPVEHADVEALDELKQLLWAKCRLNEIGYYAGPIDDDRENEDFKKAIRRYGTMRAIGGKTHYKIDTEPFLPDFDSKNKKMPDATPLYDALGSLGGGGFELGDLLAHLKREKELVAKAPVLDNADRLCEPPEAEKPLRVFLDGNRFYVNAQDDMGKVFKAKAERTWYSRPWLPLKLTVDVKTRGQGGATVVSEVLASTRMKWRWRDHAEDLERLPDPDKIAGDEAETFAYDEEAKRVYAQPASRSKTREYVDKVRTELHKDSSYEHNAREALGGIVRDSDEETCKEGFQPYWRGSEPDPLAWRNNDGGWVAARGTTVYFGPSTIAGDMYVVSAEMDLSGPSDRRKKLFEQLHEGVELSVTTAPIEAWRRVRVAAEIDWPAPQTRWDGEDLDDRTRIWEAVKREYASAYLELVEPSLRLGPNDVTLESKQLLNGLEANYQSLAECVNEYLRGEDYGAVLTRDLYDDRGARDERSYSADAVLPRVAVNRLEIDCDVDQDFANKDKDPDGGVVPSISRILRYAFLPTLNKLLGKAKSGWKGGNGAKEHAAFGDLWGVAPALSKPT